MDEIYRLRKSLAERNHENAPLREHDDILLGSDKDIFYKLDNKTNISGESPWKNDPQYFTDVYVSTLALMKMTVHASSGGSTEVMGMMTGKIMGRNIIAMDAYALPVEGTETRVNAQTEGYEYMVQYLDNSRRVGREENIIGWYHSHPDYGCWLSGIDIATQSLNQKFQDPYLAVVIDPKKTLKQGRVEMGAFRTYPEECVKAGRFKDEKSNERGGKEQEFGAYSSQYYPLNITIFTSNFDSHILDTLLEKSWMDGLCQPAAADQKQDDFTNSINQLLEKVSAQEKKKVFFSNSAFFAKFNYLFGQLLSRRELNILDGSEIKRAELSLELARMRKEPSHHAHIESSFHGDPNNHSADDVASLQSSINTGTDNNDEFYHDIDEDKDGMNDDETNDTTSIGYFTNENQNALNLSLSEKQKRSVNQGIKPQNNFVPLKKHRSESEKNGKLSRNFTEESLTSMSFMSADIAKSCLQDILHQEAKYMLFLYDN